MLGPTMSPEAAKAIADATAEAIEPFVRTEPLDPATRALPAYNCPTGTCGQDKVCEDINVGDHIDPFGRAHIERNACNRCPSTNPTPMTRVIPPGWIRGERQEITHYEDSEGNFWQPDSSLTAPIFHGDAGLGNRTADNQTYRLERAMSGGRGWQCRYVGGQLDDTSVDLGTYDYAAAPSVARAVGNFVTGGYVENAHDAMDVQPHKANPNYAPGLTETF
ncbi:MAG: hypothetical protein AAFN94_01580 [Pseudomonadota bacterium]